MTPHTCNPAWSDAERQVRAWAARTGLVTDDTGARRLARQGQGRLAGWLAAEAGPPELALLAQWGAFIAVVDDEFDQHGAPLEQAKVLLGQLLDVLDGASGIGHPVAAVRALGDLWPRTTASAVPGWAARFRERYRQFAEATCTELRLRHSGKRQGLTEYLALRRHTITALPVLDLVERALPDAPALEELREITADIIAWTNDLGSAQRELNEGTENLVGVLARDQQCGLLEAAATARVMLADRMADFDRAASTARAELIRHVRDGSLAWQRETHRNTADAVPVDEQERGVEALARHLSIAVDATGTLDDRCGSRVLESALLLSLLRTNGSYRQEQCLLTEFLRARRPEADEIEGLLIDACLEPERTADHALDRAAALSLAVSRGTAGRGRLKTVMLRTVLHLLCGSPLDHRDAPPPTSPDGITTFTDVHLLATRIVHAHACGRTHTVTDAERERLVSLMSSGCNRVLWEASATTHLLGLHAIQTFRPAAVADGLLRLTLALNADGGLPFLDSQDLWLTAVAGLAFLDDGTVRRYTPRMADLVASWQAPDGGWPFATGMQQTDVDTTTRCMEFLHAADPVRHRTALERATAYLTAIADPGGGFPTWVRGDAPDLDMTAGAILALAPDPDRHRELLAAAAEFVLDSQLSDGSFEPSWTVSESSVILRALDALHAIPAPSTALAARIAAATARAVMRLHTTQHPDGGWGQIPDRPSDVLSTAQAVPVLARHGNPADVAAAVAFLLDRQDADGGFTSLPDQVGPRPLPFDYPVLTDVHTLAALHRAGVPAMSRRRRSRGRSRYAELDARIQGVVLEPGHAAFEQARLLVNQRYDVIRPQAMAYPATPQDVVECVRFAQEFDIPLALRSGGHSYAGYSTGPGVVLDVSSLNATDVGGGRARMGAGVKGMQAHLALAAAGAGLPLGRCPTIGLAGVTLGGGLSAFTRAWGLACDHLVSAEIVTADGRLRRVDAEREPDLFWALRGGGGGNFGVVTELEFATEDVRDLTFTRFLLAWPSADLPAVVRGWSAWNTDPATPREVWSAVELLSDRGGPAPPTVTGTFIGTPAELDPVLDRLVAAIGRAEAQRVTLPCGYVQAASEAERWGGGTWGARVAFAAKSHVVRGPVGAAAATALAGSVAAIPAGGGASGLLIDGMGGAVADRAATDSAFPHRTAAGVVQYHCYWDQFTPADDVTRRLHWLRGIHAVMQPHLGTGGYTNGMDPELADWAVAYHGENYPRLQQVKAVVDPGNFFTFPQAVTASDT
ncbi:FAD-binding protein [Amycolatopsis sp. NPDC088138]|uniref:terpene synthase family protein n=1 Tax=Amycolatopsis sp. NPDC088138 TaxID=3363938 RepID=UPI0038216169